MDIKKTFLYGTTALFLLEISRGKFNTYKEGESLIHEIPLPRVLRVL